jgi:hypothetical protein
VGEISSIYEPLNYSSESVTGQGLGAGLAFPLIPSWLDFQVAGMAGKGIGRYGSAQLLDVTFDPTEVIRLIHELIGMAGLTFHPLRRLDVYPFAGQEGDVRALVRALSRKLRHAALGATALAHRIQGVRRRGRRSGCDAEHGVHEPALLPLG